LSRTRHARRRRPTHIRMHHGSRVHGLRGVISESTATPSSQDRFTVGAYGAVQVAESIGLGAERAAPSSIWNTGALWESSPNPSGPEGCVCGALCGHLIVVECWEVLESWQGIEAQPYLDGPCSDFVGLIDLAGGRDHRTDFVKWRSEGCAGQRRDGARREYDDGAGRGQRRFGLGVPTRRPGERAALPDWSSAAVVGNESPIRCVLCFLMSRYGELIQQLTPCFLIVPTRWRGSWTLTPSPSTWWGSTRRRREPWFRRGRAGVRFGR